MKAQEFAAGYAQELPEHVVHSGPQSEALREARNWSRLIGHATHDVMSDNYPHEQTVMSQESWDAYRMWLRGGGLMGTINAINLLDTEVRARAYNEINFHYLNHDMSGMWIPLWHKDGDWGPTPDHRRNWIKSAQEGLARTGLAFYVLREKYIKQCGGTETIYEGNNDLLYKA